MHEYRVFRSEHSISHAGKLVVLNIHTENSSDEETHDDRDLAADGQTPSTFFWQFAEFAEANSENARAG